MRLGEERKKTERRRKIETTGQKYNDKLYSPYNGIIIKIVKKLN